jgi:hypothetical protein
MDKVKPLPNKHTPGALLSRLPRYVSIHGMGRLIRLSSLTQSSTPSIRCPLFSEGLQLNSFLSDRRGGKDNQIISIIGMFVAAESTRSFRIRKSRTLHLLFDARFVFFESSVMN